MTNAFRLVLALFGDTTAENVRILVPYWLCDR